MSDRDRLAINATNHCLTGRVAYRSRSAPSAG